jgi:zinc D-Ala-D-Ala carboxypeptidase
MQIPARTLLCAFIFLVLLTPITNAQTAGISKAFLMGRHNYAHDTSFIKVADKYADKTIILKKAAYNAYLKMYAAAAKEGIVLNIISGTRSFYEQEAIWERKWADAKALNNADVKNIVLGILRWSSMPGTSRHHWGTDMDLVSLKNEFYRSNVGKKTYAWLCKNAAKYGFYQPFDGGREQGYQEEKWHWSYLPLAKTYLQEYIKQVTYADINGFNGASAAVQLNVIKSQVLAINIACR